MNAEGRLDARECIDAEEDDGNEHEKGEKQTGDERGGEQLVAREDAPSWWRGRRRRLRSGIVLAP
jgi:hypothetical protein